MDKIETQIPCVQILMATYNGEKYLEEQLESIYRQVDVKIRLLVRDDGSIDRTKQILTKHEQGNKLLWYTGENIGPARGFMDLLFKSEDCEYYAFSDQDDFWLSDKLKVAVEQIKEYKGPALYFNQTQIVDEQLEYKRNVILNPLLTFGEALAFQFIGGNTMVFNKALRDLIVLYNPQYLYMHDFWIYDIAVALNSKIVFDTTPHILYRQHSNNVIGNSNNLLHIYKNRLKRLYRNENIRWRTAVELMKGYGDKLPSENYELLKSVVGYKVNFKNILSLVFSGKLKTFRKDINLKTRISLLLKIF